jgi:hypothetical protein
MLQNGSLRRDSPLSPPGSGHADDFGGAEGVEAVHECDAELDFGDLAVPVSCGDALAEGLEVEQVQRHRFERTCEGILASARLRAWYPVQPSCGASQAISLSSQISNDPRLRSAAL